MGFLKSIVVCDKQSYQSNTNDIQLARRLLVSGSLTTGYSVTLQMSSNAVQAVLPDLNHAGDLTLDYSLN
jgi:hypothetical protein